MEENQKNTVTGNQKSQQNNQTSATGIANQKQGTSTDKPLKGYAEKQPKIVEKEREGREHQHDYKTPVADDNGNNVNPEQTDKKNTSQNDNAIDDDTADTKIGFEQKS